MIKEPPLQRDTARLLVVMGVSAAGKSAVAAALAQQFHVRLADADDLHPQANIEKMTAGIPLTDEDRWPWLELVGRELHAAESRGEGLAIACSALKRSYRDAIRSQAPEAVFVHLTAAREVLEQRMAQRSSHFMPTSLLDSQIATLEPLGDDERGVTVDVSGPLDDVVAEIVSQLSKL